MNQDILFLIAARSGSKSVPNKNIKYLDGKALLTYRILQALALTSSENVWLSTDSEEYANIGRQAGATIPFIRPANLATDNSSSVDVVLHAIEYAESLKLKYKILVLLEPTSPFVYLKDLKKAINFLQENEDAENVVATKVVHTNKIFVQNEATYLDEIATNISNLESIRRQDLKPQITPAGGFYITRCDVFKRNKTFYSNKTLSYLLPEICALEIDNMIDWHWAEFIIENKLINTDEIYEEF